jgi:DNA repair protein RadC
MTETKSLKNMLSDRELDREALPYERFLSSGQESLTDAELLAIIIRTGSNTSTPVQIARQVMDLGCGKERGLNSLFSLSLEELMTVKGIGEVKAIKLKALAELAKRMSYQKAIVTDAFDIPSKVADYYMEQLRHEDCERALLLCLNTQMKLIREMVLAIGTINSASVSPREIFRYALRAGANNIILIHNHPSGDPTPSRSDVNLTNHVRESGAMLDIILRDHIIIGDHSYYSFQEKGMLWQ